jgi:putative hydrolase of the HAD superfamily
MKKKVIFDLGGVLLRWRPHELLRACLPAHTGTPQAIRTLEARFFEGFGGDWAEFDRGRIEPGPLAERIATRTGLTPADARRVIDAVPDELQPLPPSVALLERLYAAGQELYFLSNMPEPYAAHLEANHDFLRRFSSGIFSARVGLVKPEPALFAHANAAFGVTERAAVFIDDAVKNVHAARAAGWQAIHFESAEQCSRELVALQLL